MYIVAIGWLYVVLMMCLTESSLLAGIIRFIVYGLLPLGLCLYIFGAPQRRRRHTASKPSSGEDNVPK